MWPKYLSVAVAAMTDKINIPVKVFAISVEEDNFCDLLFALLHIKPLFERDFIWKEYASPGNKLFPNRIDPFQTGTNIILTECVSMSLKI